MNDLFPIIMMAFCLAVWTVAVVAVTVHFVDPSRLAQNLEKDLREIVGMDSEILKTNRQLTEWVRDTMELNGAILDADQDVMEKLDMWLAQEAVATTDHSLPWEKPEEETA